jgi:hypothetical protein
LNVVSGDWCFKILPTAGGLPFSSENKHLPVYSIKQHRQVSLVQFDSARHKHLEELIAMNDETIRHEFGFVSFCAKRVQNDSPQTWQKIKGNAVIQGVSEYSVNKTPAS